MNWLAHLYLSQDDTEFRLGNLIADLVKGPDRRTLTPGVLRGVQHHQAIDAFTDAHPVTAQSRARVAPDFGRFAGILVDIYYDHVLARDWADYHPEPLTEFTARAYAEFRAYPGPLPPATREVLTRLMDEDWLSSYASPAGIESAVRRVSARLEARTGKAFALERALPGMVAADDALTADFRAFFPELRAHVEA